MSMKSLMSILAGALLVAGITGTALAAQPVLAPTDCAKCHDVQPAQIEANGSKHKTAIDCLACHEGHRPKVAKNIPKCSNCHEGKPHYQEKFNCLGCHNPHQPLKVVLQGEQKEVCVTCHANPGRELVATPSKHTQLSCNFCHKEHGAIPKCLDCHKPHSTEMTQADCATCHKPHKPLELMYAPTTASKMCGSCHGDVNTQLAASKAKHGQIACVTCHATKHKTVPKCSDCHGLPHGAMHDKFPKCGQCHSIAHDLNNWAKEEKSAPKKK
jgi:predicted CXXCH cytochrome family protein